MMSSLCSSSRAFLNEQEDMMPRKHPVYPKPRKGQSKRTLEVIRKSYNKEAAEETAMGRQREAKKRGIKSPPNISVEHSHKRSARKSAAAKDWAKKTR